MEETESERKRRLARERRAARLAARKAAEEKWRDQVEAHFHYLQAEYGFQITSVDASWVWATVLIYQSSVAAVKVARSIEFDRAEVSLIRLVEGKIPPVPVFFLPDSTLNETLLDNLIGLRAPQLMERFYQLKGLGDEQLDATLAFCASAARKHIPDVLRGDFTLFETLEEQRRAHAQKHPPTVTIWAPAEAPAESLSQLADDAQEPGVTVQVKHYRPPTNTAQDSTKPSAGLWPGQKSDPKS